MTIRPMKAAALAALVIVALAALVVTAWGSGRTSEATEEVAEAQGRRLEAALVQIDGLQERTVELEAELTEVSQARHEARTQLEAVSERLWGSVATLRRALAKARSTGSSASSDAASALVNAGAALRELAILENRFEYHLRQEGGGR